MSNFETTRHFATLAAFLVAGAVGLVYAMPNLIYPIDMGSSYKGVALVNSLDEWAYTAFAREAAEGNYLLQSQYLYEMKKTSVPGYMTLQPIPFWVLGGVFKASSMNVQMFTVLSKFVFALLLFLAALWLLRILEISVRFSIIGAAASLLMPAVWGNEFTLFDPRATWAWHLVYARPGANVAVFLLVVAYALVLLYLSTKKRSIFWIAVVAGSGALQSYFFVGAAYCVLVVVMAILHFVARDTASARSLLKILFLSCLASGWSLYNGMQLIMHHSGQNIWTSGAMEYRWPHLPIATFYSGLSVAFIWILVRFSKNLKMKFTTWAFILSIPIAHIICVNQQLITGVILEPHHFETFVFPVLTWVAFITVAFIGGQSALDHFNERRLLLSRNKGNLIFVLSMLVLALVLPLLLEPHLPRPTGGIAGNLVRGAAIADRVALTWMIAIPILYAISAKSLRRSTRSVALVGLYLGLIALITQAIGYLECRKSFPTTLQPYAGAFRWLEENSAKESVVLCSPLVGDFLPVYSHNNVYFCDYAVSAPPAEFRRRLINQLIFSGLTPGRLASGLDESSPAYDASLKFCFFYWREMGEKGKAKLNRNTFIVNYTREDVKEVTNLYAWKSSHWSVDSLKDYRLDYVMYGPIEKGQGEYAGSHWKFSRGLDPLGAPRKLFDDGSVEVYEMPK